MRTFNASVQADLDAGNTVVFTMLKLELGSGNYGLWSGQDDIFYDGVNYVGAGSLLQIAALPATTDGSARAIDVTLSSLANPDWTPDILSSFYDEAYNQKPAEISTAYYDPNTHTLIAVEREFVGRIDGAPFNQKAGGPATLKLRLESRERDFSRIGYRRRNPNDQALIDAADTGLAHAIATGEDRKLVWGRAS